MRALGASWGLALSPSAAREVPLNELSEKQGLSENHSLFEKRCALVTGKGGVGRSTVAAALALAGVRFGRRVLLTEIAEQGDDYSPLAHHFNRNQLPHQPEEIAPGLRGAALIPQVGQEMFLREVMHSAALVRAALSSETIRRLLNAGPSFREMGVYFQLLSYLRAQRPDGTPEYELILVDMPATGHTLSLTGLPDLLLKLISRGPIAAALREGMEYLNDPQKSGAWVVTLPETLPVTECLELLEGLEKTKMPIGGVILNRVPHDPFTPAERDALRPVVNRHKLFGAEGFNRVQACRRAARRLRGGMRHSLLALPEADVPEAELVPFLAGELEKSETLEAILHHVDEPPMRAVP